MTGSINNLASSLAGAPASSNAASRRKAAEDTDKARRRGRSEDSYKSTVAKLEQIDAVRKLADADQEEALEDRAEHQIGYKPKGGRDDHESRPRLDLNA